MKLTLLQVSIQRELSKLFHKLSYGCDITISIIFIGNKDVIQIHNDKDFKLLRKDLVNISLEACQYIYWTKKHHLVLEVAISSPERDFLLLSFADSYLMVSTSEVELGELFSFC